MVFLHKFIYSIKYKIYSSREDEENGSGDFDPLYKFQISKYNQYKDNDCHDNHKIS